MPFPFYFEKGYNMSGFLKDMTLDLKNPIDRKVLKTLMGKYGNWPERKQKLGPYYKEVQNKVDAIVDYMNYIG